ncbi:MAG: radical SAM protein [candidate division WOR-3 bacterium]
MNKKSEFEWKKSYYNIEIEVDKGILLYNILSKGFVLLDEKEYIEFYKNENLWDKNEKMLEEFTSNGFIVKGNDRETFLKNFDEIENVNKKYLGITFVPTQLCNFNCSYCFERSKKYDMEESIFKKSIEFIKEIIDSKNELENISVLFFGGEPLIKLDMVLKFGEVIKNISKEKKLNFSSSIITNGYYLNYDTAKALCEICNLKFVQITLDGDRNFHNKRRNNSYEILMNNLEKIKEFKDLKISIRIQVDKENIFSIKNLLNDLKKFDEDKNISFYFSSILGEFEENPDKRNIHFDEKEFGKILTENIIPLIFEIGFNNFELYPQPHAGGCGFVSENSFIIDADGRLKECLELVGEEESCGNIFDKKINKKLSNLKFKLPDFCVYCKFLPLCNGSCPLRRSKGIIKCSFWKYSLKDYLKKIYEFKFK